jgi:hypothetical protein
MTRDPTTLTPEQLALQAGLFTKIKNIMAGIGELEKKGKSPLGFWYIRHTEAKEAVLKGMVEQGVVFLPECPHTGIEPYSEKQTRSVSDFAVTLGDCDTGWTWNLDWQGEALDTQDKGFSKTVTLGFKYLLLALFLVAADEDDPDGAEGATRTRRPASTPSEPAKPLDDPGKFVMPITKEHKGKTLQQIANEGNQGLFDWVLDKIDDKPDLIANVRAYMAVLENAKSPSQPAQGDQPQKPDDEPPVWPAGVIAAIVAKKLAENVFEATNMLKLSKTLTPDSSQGKMTAWAAIYRSQRDEHDKEPAEAAAIADGLIK